MTLICEWRPVQFAHTQGGLGVGGQLGAELSEFVIILSSKSAVRSFMTSGSLNL